MRAKRRLGTRRRCPRARLANLDQAGHDRNGVEGCDGDSQSRLRPGLGAATSERVPGEEQEPHPVRQHVPALPDVPDRAERGQREDEGKSEGDGERR